ncbi:hypothetical protein K466DRAFT_607425 [Polyporus arcularius HHB13444]|uniref:Uncharacterized protein n=1 Tax=Polyporus arcularius HHB13444 TaxID=1314778 RepID=A0A5C3NKJ3_9APHY|nr:hypothetical protein K466DRAFT_607425 [Polyporus arcularius HHB13444]
MMQRLPDSSRNAPPQIHSVTSVGGIEFLHEITVLKFSSGGSPKLFSSPSYQEAAVATYLQTLGNTDFDLFNKTGRAFPTSPCTPSTNKSTSVIPSERIGHERRKLANGELECCLTAGSSRNGSPAWSLEPVRV